MWATWDKPYPYGETVLSYDDFSEAIYNDWRKLLSILLEKYGKEDQIVTSSVLKSDLYLWHMNDKIKQYGFSSIKIDVPQSNDGSAAWLTYHIASPGCYLGAKKDAAEQNAESMGVSSDDF